MSVKDMKVQLGFAKDEDQIFIQYWDFGETNHIVTDDVTVDIKEGSVTIIADLPE
jgi:hypothetical protein